METIDFNQVLTDNISVVEELLPHYNRTKIKKLPNNTDVTSKFDSNSIFMLTDSYSFGNIPFKPDWYIMEYTKFDDGIGVLTATPLFIPLGIYKCVYNSMKWGGWFRVDNVK